jgi:hypothetical protein
MSFIEFYFLQVNLQDFQARCVQDVCETSNPQNTLCEHLDSVSYFCQQKKFFTEWRGQNLCRKFSQSIYLFIHLFEFVP